MQEVIDVDALIANADQDFPALARFFREVFTPTWSQRFSGWRNAVVVYKRTAAFDERVAQTQELDLILKSDIDPLAVDFLLSVGLDCNFIPSFNGLGSIEWLLLLRHELAVV